MNKLVSIAIPLRNEERYLKRTLESICAQTYSNLQIIIADNASTDNSLQIARDYAAQDSRIEVYAHNHNIGSLANFNFVFKASRGDYFCWASGHDLMHPDCIARCVGELENRKEACLCHTAALWIDETDNVTGRVLENQIDTRGTSDAQSRAIVLMYGLGYANPIYGLIRRSVLADTGLMLPVIGADVVLLLELAFRGEFIFVDEPLRLARMTDSACATHQEYTRRYLIRCFGRLPDKKKLKKMYREMILAHLNVFWKHSPTRAAALLNVLSAYHALHIRHRIFRESLAGIAKDT
ncbi:MAG: glycosyltransferase family 2 protein [Kiritimatiellae bacterium]|nr:glycosyltransferase family 2 protein [Kiritimatiellia bacterium]MDW8459011.1 glycosyltransferase family 2 protein [Verrucomicrobiota bacterium]